METITVDVYTYDELNEEAKKHARDWFRNLQRNNGFINDEISAMFKDQLAELGLPTEDISWSLSCCQGDGVAFYGQVDMQRYLAAHRLLDKYDAIEVTIKRSSLGHHYSHANTMELHGDYLGDDKQQQALAEQLFKEMEEEIVRVSRELEKIGYKIIEDSETDEALADSIVADDFKFTVDGERSFSV